MPLHETRTVFKLGGSLLRDPDWPTRLNSWLARQPPGHYFGIVGGGSLVNALRDLDAIHHLSQQEMHWRCIRTLDATYEIAMELTPEFGQLGSIEDIQSALGTLNVKKSHQVYWLRIAAFYNPESLVDIPVDLQPAIGWSTTSDTLALFLAYKINAHRCVLLKSCFVDPCSTLEQASSEGIVDSEAIRFQTYVPAIEIRQL